MSETAGFYSTRLFSRYYHTEQIYDKITLIKIFKGGVYTLHNVLCPALFLFISNILFNLLSAPNKTNLRPL